MTTTTAPTAAPAFNVQQVRADFPILHTLAGSPPKPLVYLDNGATTQKPRHVIDSLVRFYETQNSNIHRGVYGLSQTATSLYEAAREKVRAFINAKEPAECIFTRGTTESINLVASTWARANLAKGDLVVISHLEHHSNIVPWQMACAATGADLQVIPINDNGELRLEVLDEFLATNRVRIVAVNHVSNSLGTVNPVAEIIARAHRHKALVLIDGAQWVAHGPTDVQALDADFYAFSAHKMMGPTGVGVLYGKRALLDAMPPYQGGGDMIESVTFPKTTYAGLPNKLEAGTPDIAGVIATGAAVDYLTTLDLRKAAVYEADLLAYATSRLSTVPGLRIIGTAARKAGVISFVMDQPPLPSPISTLDLGIKLDKEAICVRTGHHCCMPVMDRFHVPATARASFAFYNTKEEVDRLTTALKDIANAHIKTAPQKPTQSSALSPQSSSEPIKYPEPSAPSIAQAAQLLADDLALMGESGGPEAKSEYIMDLAKDLPHTFDLLKHVTTRVPGCMSQVYLVGRQKPNAPGTFEFVADADAEIVRGLIALLQRLFSGQRASDILSFNIESFLSQIGLESFITSQRRNGLSGMIQKIHSLARDLTPKP